MVTIRLATLSGKLRLGESTEYPTLDAALDAVAAYAKASGYTDVKMVDGDSPYDGFRVTATTPGGRSGRNVAFGEWEGN